MAAILTSSSRLSRNLGPERDIPMAPSGAVIRIASTASVSIWMPYSTAGPLGSISRALFKGIDPIAAWNYEKENKQVSVTVDKLRTATHYKTNERMIQILNLILTCTVAFGNQEMVQNNFSLVVNPLPSTTR